MFNRTTITGFVAVLTGILSYFGLNLSAEDQGILVDAISGLLAAVGVIVTAVGALKGKKSKENIDSPSQSQQVKE